MSDFDVALPREDLPEFMEFLEARGFKKARPVGAFEVGRAKCAGQAPIVILRRVRSPQAVSLYGDGAVLARTFLAQKKTESDQVRRQKADDKNERENKRDTPQSVEKPRPRSRLKALG